MMTAHQHGTGQQPDREPVLLADALATALDGIVTAARTTGEVRDPRSGGEVRDPGSRGEVRDPGSGGEVRDPGSGGEVRDPGSRGETSCRRCGATAEWHRTERGRWVLVEPGAFPTASVPAGKRWRITGAGTAVNLGSAVPSDICRISHLDVCPAATAGSQGADQPICRKPSVAIRSKTARSAS